MSLKATDYSNENVRKLLSIRSCSESILLLVFIVQLQALVQVHAVFEQSPCPAFLIHRGTTRRNVFATTTGSSSSSSSDSACTLQMLAPTSNAQTISDNTSTSTDRSKADEEAIMLIPNQSDLVEDTTVPYAVTLKRRGVARANGGLSRETSQKLRDYIDDNLEASIEEVNSFKIPRAFRFANVLEKSNRWDLLLPFDDNDDDHSDGNEQSLQSKVILEAMNELLGENGKIAPILEELLGKNAILYELACLISDPGSNRQEIHPDIMFEPSQHNDHVPLVACFVSLQDIDSSMGPTVFIPDTVSEDHHRRINDEELADEMLQSIPSNISTLGAGDCALYNPLVLHAGGGNESDRRRRLFYFTFMNSNIDDPSNDLNPGSINPILKQRNLSLESVRQILAAQSYARQ